jgi:hypothetical protein
VPTQGGDDRHCVFAGHLDQRGKARMTVHQGCDVTVVGAAQQIALPKSGDGAVFDANPGTATSEPKQGGVPFTSMPSNEFGFVDFCMRTLS